MKKSGFTLAEALISLSLIGIVAAMTIPGLVSSHKNQVCASALSAAISNFENAMTAMIMKDSADDIYGTNAWQNISDNGSKSLSKSSDESVIKQFMGDIGEIIPLESYTKGADFYDTKLKSVNGDTGISTSSVFSVNNSVVFKTKSGPAYFIYISDSEKDGNAKTESEVMEKGGNLFSKAADIVIDVNGTNNPNTIGRDIFAFYLGSDGRLYPLGGVDAAVYLSGDSDKNWYSLSSDYACTDDKKSNYGLGCTARLIDKGYKIDY